MKNNYSFGFLIKKEIYSAENKSELFFSMLNLTKNGSSVSLIDTFNELEGKLSDERYYVAHNLVSYKGKKTIFKGEMVVVSRCDLIDFLKESIEHNDLRCLLISPVFSDFPSHVISINDDAFYYFI